MTDEEYERANARMADDRAGGYALDVRYDDDRQLLHIGLSTGELLSLPVRDMQGLSGATAQEITDVRVTPSGLGIRFPKLDADFSVRALRNGIYGSPGWMKRLAADRDGRLSRTSP